MSTLAQINVIPFAATCVILDWQLQANASVIRDFFENHHHFETSWKTSIIK